MPFSFNPFKKSSARRQLAPAQAVAQAPDQRASREAAAQSPGRYNQVDINQASIDSLYAKAESLLLQVNPTLPRLHAEVRRRRSARRGDTLRGRSFDRIR